MMTFQPKVEEAETDQEIIDCHETTTEELRPHRKDINDFLARVRRLKQNHGYHLMFVRDESQKVVAIMGWCMQEHLWSGTVVYVNDLATLSSARRHGYADLLMKWVLAKAQELGCDRVTLESGFTRKAAHRFYLKHGFNFDSMHFAYDLKSKPPF